MKISIRTKLIVLLFLLIALSVGLISLQAYKITLKDMSSNAKETTRIYARNISRLIEERLQTVKEKTFYIINSAKNKDSFSKAPEVLALMIFSYDKNKTSFNKLIINPSYKKRYSLDANFFKNVPNDINFPLTISNKEYLNVTQFPNPISELIVYSFIDTSVNSKNIFSAIVIPDVILTAISSSKTSYINYLIDNTGKILAHADTSQVGINVSKLSLIDGFFADNIIDEKTMEYIDEKEEAVIGSAFKIKGSNLGVVSKILSTNAYAEARKLKLILIFSTAIVLFISLIFSIYFGKTITEPIFKLSKVTDEIALGNFLVQVDVDSKDEIGQLAKSFQHMGMELHKREETLKETQAALVQSEKMSAFGQIGAGIAHEVKNPLAGILGHAQLAFGKVQKIPNSLDIQKNLEIIEKETKRCKTIIENLMRFARQEKEVLKPDKIQNAVNEAIELVDHQLSINGIKIEKNIDNSIPDVLISINQVVQVLMNLMLNAQHAMEKSNQKILTVNLYKNNNKACIDIIDTGKGMSERVKAKIFEPFFTTKPSGQGTGLGLSVSYGIIKDHKGEIIVESQKAKGTKFSIVIPIPSQEEIFIASSKKNNEKDNNENNENNYRLNNNRDLPNIDVSKNNNDNQNANNYENVKIPKFNKNKLSESEDGEHRGADPVINKKFVHKLGISKRNDVKISRPERKKKKEDA